MTKTLITLAALTLIGTTALAKHGADDPKGDDRGTRLTQPGQLLAKHGADDPKGDDRGTRLTQPGQLLAKHGADDPKGDDRGGRRA
ncbi:hypothetical protein BurJ1DRAFT_2290 [Burkholderiales bacterium JOSHI_001]|nr:hypothetical protein BurJ1DRAFT_2290 [Burkholderiales bacterium JOSHI_001]